MGLTKEQQKSFTETGRRVKKAELKGKPETYDTGGRDYYTIRSLVIREPWNKTRKGGLIVCYS